jgi:hypothetical protein
MAVFLDPVPSSPTMNSYASIADADAYHASQLYGEGWADVEGGDDQKAQALITATRILDENVEWEGWPTANAQPLGWPRSGVMTRNGTQIINGTIPQALKNATAAFAFSMIQSGAIANSGTENPPGLKKVKAGSVELEFDPNLASNVMTDTIPANVWSMIDFLIEGSTRSRTNVNLYRM